jgi:prepilin-type N-terminal cleavage/methylation domain-containing protein
VTRRAPGRRGFTLIELMIALTISALLVGMILSIFTRMSTAYRTQQYVADLQRTLTAAHDVVQHDVRQAGFGLPDGWKRAAASWCGRPSRSATTRRRPTSSTCSSPTPRRRPG